MKKRILSLLLCVAMLLTLLPQTLLLASADDSGTCGDNLRWSYNSSTHTLTITGTGAMNSDEPWYSYHSSIRSVSLPDGLTSIGDYAFMDCTGLTSITIPGSVTSIGEYAFLGCTGLTSITIPDSVTSIVWSAFSGCTGLTSITIGNGVTSIGDYAFSRCTGLTSITIGNGVTSIGKSAFSDCTGLTRVTIGNGVTSIGGSAFYNCTGLTSITIPDSVTSIGDDAFRDCTGLTSITIPDSVTSIGDEAFEYCTGLTSVTIGNGVTSIGGSAFYNCFGLTSITIPDSVTSIGDDAFYNCFGLTSVMIGNGVTSIGGSAFLECTGLTEVHISDIAAWCGISFGGSSANPLLYAEKLYLNDTLITDLVIPSGVTSIGNYAFYYCTGLTSVTIPDSVTSIGYYAFDGCTGLTEVHISDIAAWCGISFGGSSANPLYYAKKLYLNDTLITDLVIPSGVTAISDYAFYRCTGLTAISIPDSVTSIGGSAFRSCTGLTSVTIPDSVTSIGNYAFYYCTGLTSVTIGNGVTSIGDYAFMDCTGLTAITIPDSVTSIGGSAFYNCFGLTSVTIPDSVTSIGNYAFYYCTGLTRVTIGNGVTSIGYRAFSGCTGLSLIIFRGSKPSVGSECFAGVTAVAGYPIDSSWDSTVTSPSFAGGTFTFFLIKNNQLTGAMTDFLEFQIDLNTFILTVSGPDAIPAQETFPWSTIPNLITSLALKDGITEISASAFSNMTAIKNATIPASVGKVMNNAFSGCTALESVVILNPNCMIGGATETLGVPGFTVVYGYPGSTAESWAASHGYTFKPIGDCAGGKHTYSCTEIAPTCTKTGTKTYTCIFCGNAYTETVPMLGHSFVDGVCSRCHAVDYTEGYTDTPASNNWAYAGINFAIERGLMGSTSTSEQTFEPNTKVSRAMVASILYRICGSPAVEYSGKFTDVKEGSWYTKAIEWCAQNGLASGYTDGTFKPNATVSRQELAVFMYKLAEHLGRDVSGRADLSGFADSASVPAWSEKFLQWAVSAGIISGQANGGKNYLKPADGAKRCEFASILMRFVSNPEA